MYYLWKNKKKSYESNNIKILAPKWNGKTELSNGPYSVSDIHVYFKYNIKRHITVAANKNICKSIENGRK